MRGAPAARGFRSFFAAVALVGLATPAAAIELADGRVEIHGYGEATIRSIWQDFSGANDWDLTQWWNVLNVEIEADIAPDGFGPFDVISAFARLEVRYDCVWRRACWLFENAAVYGDRSERLPQRLTSGRRPGMVGTQFSGGFDNGDGVPGDRRPFHAMDNDLSRLGFVNRDIPSASRKAVDFPFIDGFSGFFSLTGPDGVLGTIEEPGDDPGLFVFGELLGDRCVYGHQKRKGASNGIGNRVLPLDPKCRIRNSGLLRDRPNPFNPMDRNVPVLGGATGAFALPLRPAPMFAFDGPRAPDGEAQGIFIPSARHAELLRDGKYDTFDQNFRQEELEWNRGASQQDEKELKELYFDIEMFDSRLWIRVGKQNIVWGKTELFRTTDQFNPQDLALASLPSLEESRIALWALRAVWSFYEVGPLEDVRLELAMNYDQFEPTDLGRCGEPYSPLPVCDKTYGLQAHSIVGTGIAGEVRPPNPWNSWKGIEAGARLEFRVDRFSVAISDFYGFSDSAIADRLFNYTRNVDPRTGRPRHTETTERCRKGTERACLTASNALEEHSTNQQFFAMVCAASVGVSALDRSGCAQSIFNSTVLADPTNPLSPIVAIAITNILSGQTSGGLPITHGASLLETLGTFVPAGQPGTTLTALNRFPNINRYFSATAGLTGACFATFGNACPTPLVPLNADVNDGGPAVPFAIVPDGVSVWAVSGVSPFLTDEQEALLGCGPFYATNCDLQGIDFLNAEASALFQSFPVFEGTFGIFWDTTRRSLSQPGTVNFDGGPVCTRIDRGEVVMLPGCRGPGDPGYNVRLDGSNTGLVHPFTGQRFRSEMAALSWNFMMLLIGLSQPAAGERPNETQFDPSQPFRTNGCSFAAPQYCSNVQGLISLTSAGRPSVRAAGNGRFGRRDFVWASGAEVVLRYEKRNVLGFSVDFAEDVTKSNWSFEFTWIEGQSFANVNRLDGLSEVDTYNLTMSVDRPTFINFLNANRTFFFNSQIFFQWIDGHEEGHITNGPWNIFGTFTVSTGYFQDRLLPSITFVYDMRSNSSAVLPQVTYRFTENFSATFGVGIFGGREEWRDLDLHPVGVSSTRVGRHAGKQAAENGLTAIRERDEIFLRIRYTF